MTPAEEAAIRERHVDTGRIIGFGIDHDGNGSAPWGRECRDGCSQPWPCDAANLLAALDASRERERRLREVLGSDDTHFHRWCRETGSSALVCLTCGSVDDGGATLPAGSLRAFLGDMAEHCACGAWSHETADKARALLDPESPTP